MKVSLKRIGKVLIAFLIPAIGVGLITLGVARSEYSTVKASMNHNRPCITKQYIGYVMEDAKSVGNGLYAVRVRSDTGSQWFDQAISSEFLKEGIKVQLSEVSSATSSTTHAYATYAQRVK